MNILEQFVKDFSQSMMILDKKLPPAKNVRTKELYDKGIGPYQEKGLVKGYLIENL